MKKRYYNATTKEWYTDGNSLTRRVNGTLFSGVPSVAQLTAWGFREYITPSPTPQQILDNAKNDKLNELDIYDNSENVNSFIINIGDSSITAWITPEKRSDYKNSLDSAELLGMTEVTPVINGVPLTLDVNIAKQALAQIQIYANRCYNVTETHKANINKLTTIEEVESYDFTTNYPDKLVFTA